MVDAFGVGIQDWTIAGVTNGMVCTGTQGTAPVIDRLNVIGATGNAFSMTGTYSSNSLRLRDSNLSSGGNTVDISGTIVGMEFSGDAISTGGNGFKFSGSAPGGILL